jgi:thiamine monophosphate synthase
MSGSPKLPCCEELDRLREESISAIAAIEQLTTLRSDALASVRRLERELEYVRRPVRAFAVLMEKRLRENDHKGGWSSSPVAWLITRFNDEVRELNDACDDYDLPAIIHEAIDSANFAMMIADVAAEREEV